MPLLNKDARVSDVIYPGDLMKDVNRNIRKVSIILLIVAVLLGFVSLALINNTLRMSVAKRRDAIQTMKLVGAKWSLIRRPFLTQAFYIGLISSIVADLASGAPCSDCAVGTKTFRCSSPHRNGAYPHRRAR